MLVRLIKIKDKKRLFCEFTHAWSYVHQSIESRSANKKHPKGCYIFGAEDEFGADAKHQISEV